MSNLDDSDGITCLLDRGLVPLLGINGAQAGVLRPRTVGLDVTFRF